jgi:hypothetical protein
MSKSEWNLGWNGDAKVTAVYYCYLSLDKADSEEKCKHFATLFDVKQNLDWYLSTLGLKTPDEKLSENDADLEAPYSLAFDGFADVKDEIANYCDELIAKFTDDERYERIVEEMDRLSADSYSGFLSVSARKYLWVFVLYSVSAGILVDEKLKYLNHFCRIVGIDKSVLSEMEEAAKSIIALGKKRLATKASDEAYSKVVSILETLDAEEQTLHEKVNTLLHHEKESDDDESCEEKIYEPWADVDSSLIEKIGGTVMNVLDGIADGLSEFAGKL